MDKLINFIRLLVHLPFHFLLNISKMYSNLLSLLDPNGTECYWEELAQNHIDKRVNSKLKFKTKKHEFSKNKNLSNIKFFTPTKISSFRAYTLFSKEIETIEWINKCGGSKKVFFDIGANMGVYSIYYAKLFNSKVFSFEPSFRNLDLLYRNIKLNNLLEYINIIPTPIHEKEIIGFFLKENNLAGEARATFKTDLKNVRDVKTLSFSLDFFVLNKIIDKPNIIKIDVDGNEIDVLRGAKDTLKDDFCRSILVEIRKSTEDQVSNILKSCGFTKDLSFFKHKTSNVIWTKN